MKRFTDHLLFSSLVISAGAAATVSRTLKLTEQESGLTLPLFVFFSTLFTYNLTKIIPFTGMLGKAELRSVERDHWNFNNRRWLFIITLLSAIGAFLFLPSFSVNGLTFIAHLGLFSLFYALPVRSRSLRSVPFLKVFLISYVWAGMAVLPFFVGERTSFPDQAAWLMVENFSFVLAITLPFDIRDREVDEGRVKTVPMTIGILPTKMLATLFLLVSSAITWKLFPSVSLVWHSVFTIISVILIMMSSEKKSHYYYLGLLDGLLVLRLFVLMA